MEHAIRLDSERLVAVLEATLQELELLAALPEHDVLEVDASLKPELRLALQRQLAIEAAVLEVVGQQQEHEARPETLEDDSPTTLGNKHEEHDDDALLDAHEPLAISATAAARVFPNSLHRLLQRLKEDQGARAALRAQDASAALSGLAHAWTQLVVHTHVALGTSSEQAERSALSLRESTMRLREAEDDRKQVRFELLQAREARAEMTRTFSARRAGLELQLRDTRRAAEDVLGPTARAREQDVQAALSGFETHKANAQEQLGAARRSLERATQASQQLEADERKHGQHAAAELRELLLRYDAHMAALDAQLEDERRELRRLAAASAHLETHFRRLDDDRRLQLDEQRAQELAERLRRSRDGSVFRFVRKLQAVVRGFLTRRRLRLERQSKDRKKKPRRGKKSGKKAASKPKVKRKAKRSDKSDKKPSTKPPRGSRGQLNAGL